MKSFLEAALERRVQECSEEAERWLARCKEAQANGEKRAAQKFWEYHNEALSKKERWEVGLAKHRANIKWRQANGLLEG